MNLPQPQVNLERIGREGEPLVTIDGFTGDVERLRAWGANAHFEEAGADYPGLRAMADPSYLDLRRDLMMQIVGQVFGCAQSIRCEICAFSMVTQTHEELSIRQCIPHHDHSDKGRIAIMHYTQGPETGGTAFYRHRRTGFEAITPERERAFEAGLIEDQLEFGDPPLEYPYGDSERFEMIHEVAARPDRMVLYRGRLLHSGVIPDHEALSAEPLKGRLTLNLFLFGT